MDDVDLINDLRRLRAEHREAMNERHRLVKERTKLAAQARWLAQFGPFVLGYWPEKGVLQDPVMNNPAALGEKPPVDGQSSSSARSC